MGNLQNLFLGGRKGRSSVEIQYLAEEEENEISDLLNTDEIEAVEQLLEDYINSVEKIASKNVFDPLEKPDSIMDEKKMSRGAVLPVTVGTMTFDKWPNGIVKYGVDGFSANEKKLVQQCMTEWGNASEGYLAFQNAGDFNWWTRTKWVLGCYRVLRIQKNH